MTRLLFIINTFNRPREVSALLKQIRKQSEYIDVTINLYDDGSTDNQSEQIQETICLVVGERFKVNYTKFIAPHRKYLYWKLVCKNFHHSIRDTLDEFDYYFMLPDDAILTENYIQLAISQWESIKDEDKICLNTFVDGRGGKSCWTKQEPITVRFGIYHFWLCQWVDMEFICKKRFFQELDYRVRAPHKAWWEINKHRSSGVGMYISHTLHRKGLHLYQVTESLTHQIKHKSVMQIPL